MTTAVSLLLAELIILIFFGRYLYYQFVLSATASKSDWYIEYLKLCDCIDKVESHEALHVAEYHYTQFTSNVKPDSVRKHYTRIAAKKLYRKFLMYRERLVAI